MIKAVIFDFFGVLVTEGFRRFCDDYFPYDKQKRQQAIDLVTAHDSGKISHKEYVSGLAKLADTTDEDVLDHMQDNKPNNILLDYIKKHIKPSYKVGVLSNAGDNYLSQILDPKDVKIFDDIVLSYRYKMVKPQREIFELAAKRLDVSTTECVFIDDSQSHCQGAEKSGMKTVHYKDFPQTKADLEEILSAASDN